MAPQEKIIDGKRYWKAESDFFTQAGANAMAEDLRASKRAFVRVAQNNSTGKFEIWWRAR